jgi:MFS family permease
VEVTVPAARDAAAGTRRRPAIRWRRARLATNAVFFVHAAVFASWTPYIPAVKSALGLSDASLGIALLGCPVGSVGAMLVAGAVVSRRGSATVMRATLVGYLLVPACLGLADSTAGLFVVLACWGAFLGSLDMAMNAHAGGVEQRYGRSIFASFHAWWSLGAFVGTGLGAGSVALGIPLPWHLLGMGLVSAVCVLPLTGWSLPAHADPTAAPAAGGRRFARPTPVLIGLGMIAFFSLLAEGAAADWSAVYLRDTLFLPPGPSGLGYAAFAGAMFVGRLVGDHLIDRMGPRAVVQAGTALAGLTLAAGLVAGRPAAAIGGFAVLGLGLSLVVPAVFSASTRVPGTPAAPALALTTTFGWAGYLCGPPLIGLVAARFTLPVALGMVAVLCLVMTALAGMVSMRAADTTAEPPD